MVGTRWPRNDEDRVENGRGGGGGGEGGDRRTAVSGREERKEKGQKGIIKPKERRGERGIALRSGGEFRAKVFVDAARASERAAEETEGPG